jgi:hypothetical protein
MKDRKEYHMPRYAITETAGRFVAGTNNTGVGTVLTLTEKQAEHEVRLGTLRLLDVNTDAPEHIGDAAQSQTATRPKNGDGQAKISKERGASPKQ